MPEPDVGGKLEHLGASEVLRRAFGEVAPGSAQPDTQGGVEAHAASQAALRTAMQQVEAVAEKLVAAADVDHLLDALGAREGEPLLRWFACAHLPPKLAKTSEGFALLAMDVVTRLPRSAERTVALRKLLEAKDAAVRAAL